MARKRRLKSQLPDITSSLTLINKLRAKKDANEETNSQFLLSDSVYASAKIPPTDKVTFNHVFFALLYTKIAPWQMFCTHFRDSVTILFYFCLGIFMAWCQCYAGVQPGRRGGVTEQKLRVSREEHGADRLGPGLPQGPDDDHRGDYGKALQLGRQEEEGEEGRGLSH